MSESSSKTFDCAQIMRQARDKLSEEVFDMSYDELIKWLRTHQYDDPALQRLAEKAARQGETADRTSAGR